MCCCSARIAAAGVRVGQRYAADGHKERFCKKCGAGLGAHEQAQPEVREEKGNLRRSRFDASRSPVAPDEMCHGPVARPLSERNRRRSSSEKLGRKNLLSLPRLQKIVVNMGVGKALQDKNRMEQAADSCRRSPGRRRRSRKAKQAVSGFRLRENNEIGCRVTLRGRRMYEFLDRLISIALPRIRDFRGINPKSFDGHGNYSLGLSRADRCFRRSIRTR